ncbi:MAG TPA: hypothetical protein VJ808_11560 [Gemmatimonadales bacterium]|nr:hypothetical protein [Gemmatimonadales bacterium]
MTSDAVLGAAYAWAGQSDKARVILRSLDAQAAMERARLTPWRRTSLGMWICGAVFPEGARRCS